MMEATAEAEMTEGRGGERQEAEAFSPSEIECVSYGGEHHLPLITDLVDQELSEPYSIFTYRYFVYQWPNLTFLAFHKEKFVGTVVCKMGEHRSTFRGYIAMLVVIKPYRGRGIATELVATSIRVMKDSGCEEVTLEAEDTNKGALALYGCLGFIRAKRLYRYYLNGVDAFRLKLLFPRLNPSLPTSSHKEEVLTTMIISMDTPKCSTIYSQLLLHYAICDHPEQAAGKDLASERFSVWAQQMCLFQVFYL